MKNFFYLMISILLVLWFGFPSLLVVYFDCYVRFCFQSNAGGRGIQSGTTSNEATWLYGIQSLISSAYLLQFSTVYGDRLSQVPACRFSTFFKPNNCTVFAIWLSCIRTRKSFEQGRRKISFAQFLTSNHSTIPVRFNWSVCARVRHSTSVIR